MVNRLFYKLKFRGTVVRFWSGVRDFVFFEVQTGPWTHPASNPVGSERLTTHFYLKLWLKMSTSSWSDQRELRAG